MPRMDTFLTKEGKREKMEATHDVTVSATVERFAVLGVSVAQARPPGQ